MQQLAQAWLALIVDISIKSMLLAAAAGLAIVLLRLRDTNVRHRVWTVVLLGMLAMPALVCVTPAVPLPAWLIEIPVVSTEPDSIGDKPDVASGANLARESLDAARAVSHAGDFQTRALTNSAIDELPPRTLGAMQSPAGLDSPKTYPIADAIKTAQHPSITAQIASQLPLVSATVYCLVAVVLSLRLLVGLSISHRLIGQAREIHLAAPLPLPRRRSLRLLESISIHVPATVGFVRPVVLLPMSWRQWTESKLQAVLAHELAHVRRADWLVSTLAELNRALYWFHPVAWIIRRRLSELAERNCDDAVLEAAGDRTQYARHLLEVASLLTSAGSRYTLPMHGIAMARTPNVETRIDAILDAGRPLARRLGALGVMGLLVTGLPAILLAAALQPAAKDPPEPKPTAKHQSATPRAAEAIAADDDPVARTRIQLFGKVLRPDGKPAVGANVYLLQAAPMVADALAVVQTNADGGFAFDVAKDVFDVDETSEPWLIAKVLAKADGFGPALALAASFDPSGKMAEHVPLYPNHTDRRAELVADQTLRLVPDDVPIEGRIVSIEGHPIAGARVRVIAIYRTAGQPTLDSWLTAAEDQLTAFDKAWRELRVGTGFNFRRQIDRLFPDITSDTDGRFRIAGVGRESIVELQIEGPGIETRQISARTRTGETIRIADRRFPSERANIFYGSTFNHVAGPSRPVKGVVRDKATRQPLAGVKVQAYRLAGVGVQPYPNAMFYALTDTQGRYQLDGLPVGSNMLLAIGPASDPYIVSALSAEVNPDQTETTVDFALKRGVWIRGRVTDASDGRPLRANVEYAVFLDNARRREAPGYSDAFSLWYPTDADGCFQMPGFVGQGIVGVRATNYSDYPKGAGADRIDGRETNHGWTSFRTAPGSVLAENYHAVAAVTPDENGANNQCNFALVPGRKMSGNLFDSAGEPLRGAMIFGAVEGSVWQPLEDASFTVRNVDPLKPRRVQFLHSERKLAGSVTVQGDEAGPINVKLEPWATITGRIVDTVGDPLESASVASDEGDEKQLGAMPGHFDFAADTEGRFKIEGLAPRLPYNLRVELPRRSLGVVVKDLQLSPGETKDLGELSVKRPSN